MSTYWFSLQAIILLDDGLYVVEGFMNVLVIEDDRLLAEFIKKTLGRHKYYVRIECDGEMGFTKAQSGSFDAIILDITLPKKDGLSICNDLRRQKVATPIILLSAKTDEASKIAGLDAGADDYVMKPFNHGELAARLRAVTRRPAAVIQSRLVIADLELHPDKHTVTRGGTSIPLRPKEFMLLEYMMQNQDVVLHKRDLLHKVWQVQPSASSNRLEVYILQLRKKIDSPFKVKLIHTVHGSGYRLSENDG